MVLPEHPVTLTVEHIAELNRELGRMRHDINNHLSILLAAAELIRAKPQKAEEMLTTILEQPAKISHIMQHFSREFEKAYGIKRH